MKPETVSAAAVGADSGSFYSTGLRLRACEWALAVFFLYVAAISPAFHLRSQLRGVPSAIAAVALLLMLALAWAEEQSGWRRTFSFARDWVTLILVFTAYREMDWFTPKYSDYHLEKLWVRWDRMLLNASGTQGLMQSTGGWLLSLLELSYLLVYAVGPFLVVMFYVYHRRPQLGRALFVYVVGTVAAYGLFPYFPSSPPRAVFPGMDMPQVASALRTLNLHLVGGYGIHSSVFPSAHVSSAFSAAWATLLFLPGKKKLGWGMAGYAALVAVATVYGRYHYAADALAGFGVSLAAALAGLALRKKEKGASEPAPSRFLESPGVS